MIDRNTYINLKHEIKYMSRPDILKLCDNMMLDKEERTLLINFYDNKMIIGTCMELNFGTTTYNKKIKALFTKIYNYKNTLR